MYKYSFSLSYYSFRQMFRIIFILSLLFYGGYHISCICSPHIERKNRNVEIGFQSIPVKEYDTLWSIAKEHYTEEYHGSLNDYIREIKRCNSLTSSCINAGSSIVVPIYTPKKQPCTGI